MTRQTDEFLSRLELLLQTEKDALLTADFTRLPAILDEKIQLVALLEASGSSPAQLTELKKKISHNQSLLDEAMAAIRASSQKISELRRVRRTVSTYDHMGHKYTLRPDADVSVEKKA